MNSSLHAHLDDADLVRILDLEPEPATVEMKSHIGECAECASRLRQLEARASALSALLESSRPAMPAPPADLRDRIAARVATIPQDRSRRRWWTTGLARAAALAGLLITGALVAEPSRQWIIDRVVPRAPAVENAVPGTRSAPVATQVGFVPSGNAIVIRIDNRQRDGTVTLQFEDRSDVMGEVITDDPDADLLAMPPTGFRIRNEEGDTWSYRFRVPLGVRVEVIVAGATVAAIEPPGTREVEIRLDER